MKAVDTNVLLRLMVGDDPVQSPIAAEFARTLSPGAPAFICREVLQELVWVLERARGYSRASIAGIVGAILESEDFVVETSDRVSGAIAAYVVGGPGFADRMILLAAEDAGATLHTFDAALSRLPGATMVNP